MSDELLNQISQRLQAIGEQVNETRLKELVNAQLQALLADKDFTRKMRFAAGDAKLTGSKFSRYNLSAADIEFVFDLMQAAHEGGLSKRGVSDELRAAFADLSESAYLSEAEIRKIDVAALDGLFPRVPKHELSAADKRILAAGGKWQDTAKYAEFLRAMDTAESGYGSQLVGAQYVGELWQAARAESRVFGLIDTFDMQSPTSYLPVEVDIPEMLYVSENAANNSSEYTTVKTGSQRVAVSAAKFVIHQMWSGEMEEDSILPFVPFLRRQAELAVAHYSDSLVLNGDTTNAGTGNINLDDADPADTKHYLAFDGIRHAGLVDNTANSKNLAGTITLDALAAARGRMMDETNKHDWGHPNDPSDLIYVCDPGTADAIAALDPVLNARIYNGGTNLLSGQVAAILGYPVISSPAVSKTEADGKVSTTGNNNTKGQVVTFNRRGFKAGWRRRVKLETERIPATDQSRIVASLRMGFTRFTPTGAASGLECADVIYNVTI